MRRAPLLISFALGSLSFAALRCSSSAPAGPAIASSDANLDAFEEGGPPGSECTFNRDCRSDARCACTDGNCKCETGPRGKGKSGVDLCKDGNDCESSVCVEGTGDVLTCSGECNVPADCGPKLPACKAIALLGKICARATP